MDFSEIKPPSSQNYGRDAQSGPKSARKKRNARLIKKKKSDLIRKKKAQAKEMIPKEPLERERKDKIREPKIVYEKTLFEEQIESYINRGLATASSHADKIYIYKRAFDFLLDEFQMCRPLLSKIRKHYDITAADVLKTKRELIIGATNQYNTEENYNEMVTKMRKVKNHEFKILKQKSNDLIQELIELRISKSYLSSDIKEVNKKFDDLECLNKLQTETTAQLYMQSQLLQNDIMEIEKDTIESKKEVKILGDKLKETTASVEDLKKSYEKLSGELNQLLKDKEKAVNKSELLKKKAFDTDCEHTSIARHIARLEGDIELSRDKLNDMKERHKSTELKMRQMLREAGIVNDKLSVAEIIANMKNNKYGI